MITAAALGSSGFRSDYGLRYAYAAGAMYKGIASVQMVVAMAKARLMSYFGSGGLSLAMVDEAITSIQAGVTGGEAWGVNLLHDIETPQVEEELVDLLLRRHVRYVEAAAFTRITPALVRYRLNGVQRMPEGRIITPNRILAKVSRPEIAATFMAPAPEAIVRAEVARGTISQAEAALASCIPVAQEICVESDSGGHTDRGIAYAQFPRILRIRDRISGERRYEQELRIGAAGGIGTPAAAAASFIMGADFVMTGSINQCTAEAGTSDRVKDMLQDADIYDMAYAPAGDMFELGAKVQVLKKGLFFPARANKLYETYHRYRSLDEIEPTLRSQIESKYFRRSFEDVWNETEQYYRASHYARLIECSSNPKKKLAAVFKWYFVHSTRLAMSGSPEQPLDYQIQCGPAMGAFNEYVKGTPLESWRNRHVAQLGGVIMEGTAEMLNNQIASWVLRGSGERFNDPARSVLSDEELGRVRDCRTAAANR